MLILLSVLQLVLKIILGVLPVFLVAKLLDRSVKFLKVLIAMLIYMGVAVLIYLFLEVIFTGFISITAVKLGLYILLNLVSFYLIVKKFFNFSFGQSLITYLIILIVFPIINFVFFMIYYNVYLSLLGRVALSNEPLISIVISKITEGIFGASSIYFRSLMVFYF